MPFAHIHREEVMQRAGEIRHAGRRLPGSARAVYACLVLSIDTDTQEAAAAAKEKRSLRAPCERIVESARSWIAAKTGYSERSVTRALKLLPRTDLLKVVREADDSDVFRRRVQQYVLPLAPRGHWRRSVPKGEAKRARQDERSRQKREDAARDLPPDAPHPALASFGSPAVAVAELARKSEGSQNGLPCSSLGRRAPAAPAPQEERGGVPPRIPPAERARTSAGAIPRESPPAEAAVPSAAWNATLGAVAKIRERLALAPRPPDPSRS